jgi:hypothetical protein
MASIATFRHAMRDRIARHRVRESAALTVNWGLVEPAPVLFASSTVWNGSISVAGAGVLGRDH